MSTTFPTSSQNLLTLREAAEKLGVSVEVLLKWNDYHILTPKITLTGEVGYTQEQLTQFLAIHHTLQTQHVQQDLGEIASLPHPTVPMQNMGQQLRTKQPSLRHRFPWTLLFFASATFLVAFLTQQGRLTSLMHGYELSYQNTQTKSSTSTAQVTEPVAINHAPQLTDTNTSDTNLHQYAASIFTRDIFAKNTVKSKNSSTADATKQVLASADTKGQAPIIPQASLGNITTLASVGQWKDSSDTNQTLDNNGNIVGDAGKSDTIATVLGAGSPVTSYGQPSTANPSNVALLLMTGFLAAGYVLLRPKKPQVVPVQQQSVSASDKILEINQKMDGTVVLSFRGKDYKISKPELDSDSDKFIERLMQLMQSGVKELEYESHSDTLRLTTPLSRIVTRLGFVGLKRDLFFPRTSKHAVFFRRYVTYDDLTAMNLTVDQLAQELQISN